jgi:hypothetical protein
VSTIIRQFERDVVKRIIDAALAEGRQVSWNHDGYIKDDDSFIAKDSSEATLDDAFACDDVRIWIDAHKPSKGFWIYLVFGNGGWDVVADYSTRAESFLEPISAYYEF